MGGYSDRSMSKLGAAILYQTASPVGRRRSKAAERQAEIMRQHYVGQATAQFVSEMKETGLWDKMATVTTFDPEAQAYFEKEAVSLPALVPFVVLAPKGECQTCFKVFKRLDKHRCKG
jgi:hypothetical protein